MGLRTRVPTGGGAVSSDCNVQYLRFAHSLMPSPPLCMCVGVGVVGGKAKSTQKNDKPGISKLMSLDICLFSPGLK